MNTHRAPSGQELWHLEKAVFLGHCRSLCGLISDPHGVGAKAALVCSCDAACGLAEMPVTVIVMDLPTLPIMPQQKLPNGKRDGWKTTGGEVREGGQEGQRDFTHGTSFLRANRKDWFIAAVYTGAVPPIKAFSC